MGKDLNGKELGLGYAQDKRGRYIYRFTNRFNKRVTIYGKSIQQCRAKAKIAIKDDLEHKNFDSKMSINELYEMWYSVYSINEYKSSSRREFKQCYNKYIRSEFGNVKIGQVNKTMAAEMYAKIKEKGAKVSALEKSLRLFNSMYEYAINDDIVYKNPFKDLKYPIRGISKRRALNVHEINTFFQNAYTYQYFNAYIFLINTGLRCGELCGLEISDIDFNNRTIKVSKQLSYCHDKGVPCIERFSFEYPKTPNSIRTVPLNHDAFAALKNQLEMREIIKEKYLHKTVEKFYNLVFTTRYFTPLNESILNQQIKTIIDKFNWYKKDEDKIKYFTLHDLRLTFATQCYFSGIDAKQLQIWMGHKNYNTTLDIYVKLDEEATRENINKVSIISDELRDGIKLVSNWYQD